MVCLRTSKIGLYTVLLRDRHDNTFLRYSMEGTADAAAIKARYLFDDYPDAESAVIVDTEGGPDSFPINFVLAERFN